MAILAASVANTTTTIVSSSEPAPSDSILRKPEQAKQQINQTNRKILTSKDIEVIDQEAID